MRTTRSASDRIHNPARRQLLAGSIAAGAVAALPLVAADRSNDSPPPSAAEPSQEHAR